ncbi:MAG: single-stranded-DNA-specific exonuclease, single-stranded-DNA-specific exonuclease [Candidatus Parcubacteria bacterium]|jgi:single-stranded-DNA-specific exonuclease
MPAMPKEKKTKKSKYSVRPALSDADRSKLVAYPDMLAHLLFHRGITDVDTAERFINPDYDRDTHDPFLLAGMEKAVERILRAVGSEEKTVIYSDYDTDGIPAGVALHDFFKKIGFKNFTNYIPHRHDEGFGLNEEAIERFVQDGVKLLITIDCGIADVGCVRLAQEKGIDVIVTDHHLPGEILPPAYAIVNPKQSDCLYPEKMLCGAGVIYKVIQALAIRGKNPLTSEALVKSGWEKWLLDMIGIATLSDMVPLTGENRAFAHYGLRVLRMSPRLGLVRLLSKLGVAQKHLVEDDIGFTIGPRINAASRMGVPMDAFRLLATDDETEADLAADHLNAINDERKAAVAVIAKEVKKVMKERYGTTEKPTLIFTGNPKWKPSLLGLVANTLAEEFTCPVYLWGRDGDGVLKGSCRSDGVTNLVEIMRVASETHPGLFIQYGGHSQSGGFAVSKDMVHRVEEALVEALSKIRTLENSGAVIGDEQYVDAELSIDHVSWNTYAHIEKLAPFGTGNPKPVFIFRNVRPVEVKSFGKEKNHLELAFGVGKYPIKAIGFFMTPEMWNETLGAGRELRADMPIDLIATFEKSMFRGRTELRLRIVDIL